MTNEWYERNRLEEMREQTKVMREQTAVMRDILEQLTTMKLLIASETYNNLAKLSSDDQISEGIKAICRAVYSKSVETITEMESNK